MQNLDSNILITAITSFFIFIFVHLGTLRYTDRANILKTICKIFGISWIIGFIFLISRFFDHAITGITHHSTSCFIISVALESSIYGLLCFLYVLYIFGPYESSIRFRLIFELYKNHPQALSREEIEKEYNPDIFLKRRLARLLASGDIILDDKIYRLARNHSIFTLLDDIALKLNKIITNRLSD